MDKKILTYDLDKSKTIIKINFYNVCNYYYENSTKRYFTEDYNTKEKIKVDLYNKLIDDFKLDNRNLENEFYDMLDLMLDNLCTELKIDK